MGRGLWGRFGEGCANLWDWARECTHRREQAMPDYEGLPRIYRPPKKKLSHISEGHESLFTRTSLRHNTVALNEDNVAEHNDNGAESSRFYGGRSQSLPSSAPDHGDGRGIGDVLSAGPSGNLSARSPHLSSTPRQSGSAGGSHRRDSAEEARRRSEESARRSSGEDVDSARRSMEAVRQSRETARTSLSYAQGSVRSGVSWVPDLPSPEQLTQRRRRRSTDMLGGHNADRQRIWEDRRVLDSVRESPLSYVDLFARAEPISRLDSYLDEQGRRAPLDARRRALTRPSELPDAVMPPSGLED